MKNQILLLMLIFLCGCSTGIKHKGMQDLAMPEVYQIEYEFGLEQSGKVIITRSDDNYYVQVIGLDKSDKIIISYEKIVRWAFTSLVKELGKSHFANTFDSYPFNYSIRLLTRDEKEIIKIDSSKKILNNPSLENKLKELRSYLINLWVSSLNK